MISPSVWREEFQQVEIESTARYIGEARPAGKTGASNEAKKFASAAGPERGRPPTRSRVA